MSLLATFFRGGVLIDGKALLCGDGTAVETAPLLMAGSFLSVGMSEGGLFGGRWTRGENVEFYKH